MGSERFIKQVNRIRKENSSEPLEKVTAVVRKAFVGSLGFLPDGLIYDLFDYYMIRYENNQDSSTDKYSLFYHLGDVIDLFDQEYDEDGDPLNSEEWDYIKETMNEYADRIDMKLVTYIMRILVSKKMFQN